MVPWLGNTRLHAISVYNRQGSASLGFAPLAARLVKKRLPL